MLSYPVKPYKHQLEGVELWRGNDYRYLFRDEMGSGKTLTALLCLRTLYHELKRIPKVLIVSPLSVMEQWKREAKVHCELDLAAAFFLYEGTPKQKEWLLAHPANQICIVNFEATRSKNWKALTKRKWDMIVVDESHRIKDPKSLQHREIVDIADRCRAVICMTGTPITNKADDIWGQLRALHNGCVADNYFIWRKQHFYDANASKSWVNYPAWTLQPGKERAIQSVIDKNSREVKTAECVDMPPLIRSEVYVDLEPGVRRIYKELEEDFITLLDSGEPIIANLALTKLLRLQQICNGAAAVDDGVKSLPCDKLRALREIFDTIPKEEKRVIWCNFRTPLRDIYEFCHEQELGPVIYSGGQTAEDKREALRQFKEEDSCKVFIGTQAAGGTGIDGLQIAKYAIYYSKGYNLEHDLQSQARTYRAGSHIHDKVRRIDIVTRGTVEEKITDALARKIMLAELLTGMKRKGNSLKLVQENDLVERVLTTNFNLELDVDGY